jgi:riboflavin kinase / FMN adenylyltransferase
MDLVRLEPLAATRWPSPAVTVGNFDGVHRGHQALVAAAVEEARGGGGSAVALTFDPHPSHVLSPDRAPDTLMTLRQKAEALEALGIDHLAVLPFTAELSRKTPEEFARRVLHEALSARVVVVGANFRFGRGRSGDLAALTDIGQTMGFRVRGVAPVLEDGEPISSTRIREALARGAVDAARALIGRRYFVEGEVVRGEGRGRTLGIPTANLALENETVPGGGVYAAWASVRDGSDPSPLPAVVNVGRRPTFGGVALVVEAHLLVAPGDLYGRRLRVEFESRLREERRFEGAAALVEQIRSDIEEARRILVKP